MKKLLLIFAVVTCCLGCTTNTQDTALISSLNSEVEKLKTENEDLKKTIELLKCPASDRLRAIKELIIENKFEEASQGIKELKELFPLSEEAKQCGEQENIITAKKEKILAEQARIKALGFKALKEVSTVNIFYNKVSVGSFSVAKTFAFDAYDDSYFYKTADRGNKYISARITITSEEKDPKLPVFYAYTIDGDKLQYEGHFILRFARWRDYATYLGNYNDNGNDFSKTSTIPFKIGIEVSDKVASKPLVILCRKQNCMIRNYDRFDNPPVSYSIGGGCTYDTTLTIDDLKKGYAVVKVLNKNKL